MRSRWCRSCLALGPAVTDQRHQAAIPPGDALGPSLERQLGAAFLRHLGHQVRRPRIVLAALRAHARVGRTHLLGMRGDPALRERLAAKAYEIVMAHYTWDARAQLILRKVESPWFIEATTK